VKNNRILFAGVLVAILIAGGLIIFNIGRGSGETPQIVSSSEEINGQLPTARTGLEATDPGTVNLKSGSLQLVEAFAFW